MPGPIYKQIKENKSITTEDGKIIYREDYLGPNKQGRVISILGDTRSTKQHQEFVKNSDVLIHEATFDHSKQDLAYQYFHSTTVQAAMLAKDAQVKKLILTHISSRYQKKDVPFLLQEAKRVFPNTVLAHDFYRTAIKPK